MIPSGYYSYNTQKLSNYLPTWMKFRDNISSVGQQFVAPIGMQMDTIQRNYAIASGALFLQTADINVASELYRVDIPHATELSQDIIHIVIGDGNLVTVMDELDIMLYDTPPTRVEKVLTQSSAPSGIIFNNEESLIPYDLPFVGSDKTEKATFFKLYYNDEDVATLEKFYKIDSHGHEPLTTTGLLDVTHAAISGDIIGSCLSRDYIIVAVDGKIQVFDTRIPIRNIFDADWSGNLPVDYITSVTEDIAISDTEASGIGIDIDRRYFWVAGSGYTKYKLFHDYGIFDYDKKKFYTIEQYDDVSIDGVSYEESLNPLWNYFDEFGLKLDTPRLLGESNEDYKDRLHDTVRFRSNSTIQGVIDGVTRENALRYWGWFNQGSYPDNLFDGGIFPSGYDIYVSGNYPANVSGIAKISPLFDPTFYNQYVDPSSNIPSERFVDFTKEILETFPLLWGSGENDPNAFIWDLAPFDGGSNNTGVSPEFFANIASGIDPIYFQSGVEDPNSEDLLVRIIPESGNVWTPQVHTGDFFIHNESDYLYSEEESVYIPSGVVSYTIPEEYAGPFYLYDPLGIVTPSGFSWSHEASLSSGSPEYSFAVDTSGTVTINRDHSGLILRYESNPGSEWHSLPWDFNPLHGMGYDGFIWISNKKQVVNSDGFTFVVTPTELPIGGSQSLLVGTLLDTDGNPVIGAEIYFNADGYPGSVSPNNTAVRTVFDGSAVAAYTSPASINDIMASGTLANVTDNPTWVYSFNSTPDIYNVIFPDGETATDSVVSPATFVTTTVDGVQKLWAVKMGPYYYGMSNPYDVMLYSTTDGINWYLDGTADVTAGDNQTLINGLSNVYRGNPLYTARQQGEVQKFITFKGQTYARTWTGLWRTSDAYNWENTWAAIDASGNIKNDGPSAQWGEGTWSSLVVLNEDESNETLFELGGLNLANVWKTTDGFVWTKATDSAPWAPRSYASIVGYDGKLWVIGGNKTALPFIPYGPNAGEDSASDPATDMWFSEDGATWTSWGSLPFSMTCNMYSTVYDGLLWIIGGRSKIGTTGTVWSNEVWSFDGEVWKQWPNAPWQPACSGRAINFHGKIRLIGGYYPLTMHSSRTGWAFNNHPGISMFYENKFMGTNYEDMLLYYEKPDISGYKAPVKILMMAKNNSYAITTPASGWTYNSDSSGYEFVIGGDGYYSNLGDDDNGDDAHNIDVQSLKIDGTAIFPAGTSGAWFTYEIDSYSSPQDYGKVIVSTPMQPLINQVIEFDTYGPLHPMGSEVTASGTYLQFESMFGSGVTGNIHVVYPGEVQITASGWYEDEEIAPKYATIKVGLGATQQGVFRLDDKFIDYFSYLRWTGL